MRWNKAQEMECEVNFRGLDIRGTFRHFTSETKFGLPVCLGENYFRVFFSEESLCAESESSKVTCSLLK